MVEIEDPTDQLEVVTKGVPPSQPATGQEGGDIMSCKPTFRVSAVSP